MNNAWVLIIFALTSGISVPPPTYFSTQEGCLAAKAFIEEAQKHLWPRESSALCAPDAIPVYVIQK